MPRYWYSHKNYQRECEYIFADILDASFNDSVEKSSFTSSSKNANIRHIYI